MDERAFIRGIERLDAAEFAGALLSAGRDERRALRAHLGPDAFERMRERAGRASTRAGSRGNVVVLHGIMGGELTEYETDAQPRAVWLRLFRILRGGFSLLPLAGGASVKRIAATGILKRYYGEQLLSLMAQGWNTHAYWFDWRLDMRESADTLALRISEWFRRSEPVHLVAHSMGGLVARMFIRRHPELWRAMWDAKGNGARGGRLVMLGTPNHGSFAIPHLLFGLNGSLRKLALLDLFHSLRELIEVAKTFTGIYQMLPSPLRMPGAAPLYSSAAYSPVSIDQAQLDSARAFHEELASDAAASDAARLVYIAGCDQPTYTGVRDWDRLASFDGYDATRLGDGTVPHALGLLDGVPAYYVEAEHGALPCNGAVMAALDEILAMGATDRLSNEPRQPVRGGDEAIRSELALRREAQETAARDLGTLLRDALRKGGDADPEEITDAERQLEDLLIREFARAAEPRPPAERAGLPGASAAANAPGTIRIRLSRSSIADVEPGEPPVDAIAVGHYIGVRPAGAELALDEAISAPLGSGKLITAFTRRGVLRGDIGQPFFFADPRETGRLVAVAGLGYPGRCGAPELAIVVRELVWSIGRLGKRHLAAVLIGSGEGNLSTREAMAAWMEGISAALAGAEGGGALAAITFVENDARKLLEMRRALASITAKPVAGVAVEVTGPEEDELIEPAAAEAAARARAAVLEAAEGWEEQANSADATRLTVDMEGHVYRYGAVTRTASVPERRITLDPELVQEANDALAAARDAAEQRRLGQYLLKLLFPADLRNELSSAHPLVVACDSSAARVHWEMIAQPGAGAPAGTDGTAFLGIHRGLTRQLRTQFAPPPEPPPAAGRVLRVLIVADGARDAPLPGAAREGEIVRELFSRFREQELAKPAPARRAAEVEITALIGPEHATRTRVMQELLLRQYDVLHYAGHCFYDGERPSASGWVFTGEKRLTAGELSRVDRVPAFVFANACESGVTPDRAGNRSAGMAPGFAESFFARGVRDFICTGWPVGDEAALEFAETFYTCLLGLDGRPPEPAHAAMRKARARIFEQPNGSGSWGAYQHYGDPYTRLVAGAAAVGAAA